MLRRLLYLGYYIKENDYDTLRKYIDYVASNKDVGRLSMVIDSIYSAIRYNISLEEYFQFEFYDSDPEERKEWAGMGYMYEYQLEMNPRENRDALEDKRKFADVYDDFILHKIASRDDVENRGEVVDELLNCDSGKLVFKDATGQCGSSIVIKQAADLDETSLLSFMRRNDLDLVEEFVEQHSDLNRLSPAGVNTIRVMTQLDGQGEVDILGTRIRITVDNVVDNLAAGNIAAPIDTGSGRISGPAVYSDITKEPQYTHPVTGEEVVGFQIPFWNEIISMCKEAARKHPQNRSIGWDVVVTEEGPGLIEGNHDWCKLLWQLPVQKGLKPVLESYR